MDTDTPTLPIDAAPSTAAADTCCAHCAQPVPAGLVVAGAEHQFCCAGCQAVYETIHACGLDAYYRLRAAAGAAFDPAAPSAGAFAAFDQDAFQALHVVQTDGGARSVDLVLEGVTCAACVWLVERLPKVLPGVTDARLSLREATVRVTWDPAAVSLSRIARALDRFGYTPHPAKGQSRRQLLHRDERRRLVRLGAAGALMGNTMLLALALYAGGGGMDGPYRTFFRSARAVLGTLSLAWPGAVFFTSAWAALRARALNLDVPIALALAVGGVAGAINVVADRGDIYFDSLTVLVFLLLVGRWIQYRQQRRADTAVELLFSLTPSTCRRVTPDGTVEVPVEALAAGDEVEVRSGELIPADGAVTAGRSAVDQALLTGESTPIEVGPGSAVCAGAQNVGSILRVRADKVGPETRVGQLMRLVERGVADKPAIVRFADRVGAWFILAVSLAAAGTFAYWVRTDVGAAIDHTVALLIVTCPCVLGLATPLTIGMAIGRLARRDVLVKSGAALERLSRGGRIFLDKTGTLTEGGLVLVEWAGDDSVRAAVAAVERTSNHPVARALVAALGDPAGDVADVSELHDGGVTARVDGRPLHVGSPGFVARHAVVPVDLDDRRRALESTGATVVLIARDGHAVALAALVDRVRRDAAESVAALAALGWQPSILSGDARAVVADVAARVGVDPASAHGGVTPEGKLAAVRAAPPARDPQCVTVMVGDGVNDAAALAAADVGIAVHGGAEASLAAADVYVARPGLAPVVDLARTARQTMCVIRRNLFVSLAYNVLAGALAAAGVMTPLIAAIVMPVSSATVLSLAVAATASRGAGGPAARRTAVPEGATPWK